jgi:hypothetical protein
MGFLMILARSGISSHSKRIWIGGVALWQSICLALMRSGFNSSIKKKKGRKKEKQLFSVHLS